jgi:hypothetical protein
VVELGSRLGFPMITTLGICIHATRKYDVLDSGDTPARPMHVRAFTRSFVGEIRITGPAGVRMSCLHCYERGTIL